MTSIDNIFNLIGGGGKMIDDTIGSDFKKELDTELAEPESTEVDETSETSALVGDIDIEELVMAMLELPEDELEAFLADLSDEELVALAEGIDFETLLAEAIDLDDDGAFEDFLENSDEDAASVSEEMLQAQEHAAKMKAAAEAQEFIKQLMHDLDTELKKKDMNRKLIESFVATGISFILSLSNTMQADSQEKEQLTKRRIN